MLPYYGNDWSGWILDFELVRKSNHYMIYRIRHQWHIGIRRAEGSQL